MKKLILLSAFIVPHSYPSHNNVTRAENDGEQKVVYSYSEFIELAQKFFQELAGGDINWVINLLKKHPDWAKLIDDETGNTPLLLAIKNYSGRKEEKKLICLLVELAPEYILRPNKSNSTVFETINTFGDYRVLLKNFIKMGLATIKIDEFFAEHCLYLLQSKSYKRFINIFMDHPYLIYLSDKNGKTLQDYCDEADDQLEIVAHWIQVLKL